jgi:hypothetical protein
MTPLIESENNPSWNPGHKVNTKGGHRDISLRSCPFLLYTTRVRVCVRVCVRACVPMCACVCACKRGREILRVSSEWVCTFVGFVCKDFFLDGKWKSILHRRCQGQFKKLLLLITKRNTGGPCYMSDMAKVRPSNLFLWPLDLFMLWGKARDIFY